MNKNLEPKISSFFVAKAPTVGANLGNRSMRCTTFCIHAVVRNSSLTAK
jgi:hypothetical protein